MQEVGTAEGLRYPRYGNTPNAELVQTPPRAARGCGGGARARRAAWAPRRARCSRCFAPGDHLLASRWIYGGTHQLAGEGARRRWASTSTLVDPSESRGWRKRLRKNTRAIFLESPVNPDVPRARPQAGDDAHARSWASRSSSIRPSRARSTFRPIEHGADVVIHSATKYLNGHHDVIARRGAAAPPRTSKKCARR